jgi:hypothetical protein
MIPNGHVVMEWCTQTMKNIFEQRTGITEIRQKRFHVMDKAALKAKSEIQAAEDRKIFEALNVILEGLIPEGVVVVSGEEILGRAIAPDTISVETLACMDEAVKQFRRGMKCIFPIDEEIIEEPNEE